MKLALLIIVHVLVFFLALGLAWDFGGSLDWKTKAPQKATLETAAFSEQLRLSGILEARDIQTVYAGVTGTVKWMIEEGTFVNLNTPIIKFDDTDLIKQYDSKNLEFQQNKENLLQQFRYAQRNKQLQRMAVLSALLDVEDTCLIRDTNLGLPVGTSWRQVSSTLPGVPEYPLWKMQGAKEILKTQGGKVPVPTLHPELLSGSDYDVPELATNVIEENFNVARFVPRFLQNDLQNALNNIFVPQEYQLAAMRTGLTMQQSESDRRWAAEDLLHTQNLEKQGLQSLAVLQAKQQTATAAELNAQRDEILDRLNLMGPSESVHRQADFALLRQTLSYRKIVKDADAEVRKIDLDLLGAKLRMDASMIDLIRLKENLKHADTLPPISGVVAYVDIWKGGNETMSPLQVGDSRNMFWDLAKIADTSSLRVRVVLDESDYHRIQLTQKAIVHLPSFPELALPGEIEEIQAFAEDRNQQLSSLALDNRGEAFVRSFNVYIRLDAIPPAIHDQLRLGLTAEVDIASGAQHQGLSLPPEAIAIDDKGQAQVYLVDSGSPNGYRAVNVKLGSRTPSRVEILPAPAPAQPLAPAAEVYLPYSLPTLP